MMSCVLTRAALAPMSFSIAAFLVKPTIGFLALPVHTMVDAVAFAIHPTFHAITLAIKPSGALIVAF